MSAVTATERADASPVRVLELRSIRGAGGGPEKTILLGAVHADIRRVETIVCYIRDVRDAGFGIDRRAAALGVDYVEVLERGSFDVRAWSDVRRIVRQRRIDVVHAHEYKTNLLAWWLAAVENVIPLSTAHGWSGETWRERCVYYPAERLLLSRFPRLIAVSSDIRDRLIASGAKPERVSTILNAIDPDTYRRDPSREADARRAMGLAPDDLVIGTVGRLEPGKGFGMLLEAFIPVRTVHPSARLVFVGDGSLRSRLDEQARALFPDDTCLFLGQVSDVIGAHHAFDLFVHPSDHEGTPNAVLEAMALDTPVVATDAGGTSELLHDRVHGLIVPCKNTDALSHALLEALGDRALTASRAAAARRRVEQSLSFQARMRAVENIYAELLAGRTGAPAPVAVRVA